MFTPASLTRAIWALRVVLAVQCTGMAMKLLWGGYETESDIYGWLYFDLDWPEVLALRIENIGTIIYCAGGWTVLTAPVLTTLLRKFDRDSQNPFLDRLWRILLSVPINFLSFVVVFSLAFITLWQGAISTLHAYRGGSFMAEWAIAAHAVRIFTPLALIALLLAKGEADQRRAAVGDWILRLAIAATFITHGIEAIRLNPAFVDLLIGSAYNLLGWSLAESTTTIMLWIIGTIDVVLAIALLLKRWRLIAGYLAFWGFVTACSRITAAGLIGLASAYPETLIRAANGGAPLAVCILCYVAAANITPSPVGSGPE